MGQNVRHPVWPGHPNYCQPRSGRLGASETMRSAKLEAHEPAGLAAASPSGLADAAETVRLEERDGTHVTAGLVDAVAARVDRVAFQRGSAHRSGMPDRALQQLVHEAPSPEPRPHHKADHRPRALVLDVRD